MVARWGAAPPPVAMHYTGLTGGSLLTLAEAPVGAEFRNLRIAVIPGTTTEQVLKTAVTQSGAAVQFLAVPDHAAGLAALEQQTADAYASDRIILIGWRWQRRTPGGLRWPTATSPMSRMP